MRQARVTRKKKEEILPKKIKEKFSEERLGEITSKPLLAMNELQKKYIDLIAEKSVVLATGFAGTSKSYIPACIAADSYRLGKIKKIYLTRPPISTSKGHGFYAGSVNEKMEVWLSGIIPVLRERLGSANYEIALSKGDIILLPLEVIKGLSLNDSFFICEESSDLTKDEVIKLVSRLGKNSTMILAGDILQSELKETSGLLWLTRHVLKHENLSKHFGWVDFNKASHIVRSAVVKEFILSLGATEEKSINKDDKGENAV